jgi:hypothetical protein
MQYIEKFETEKALINRYTKDKAFLVWAMGLYLDVQDRKLSILTSCA